MSKDLYERLSEYAETDHYPMHMPGHKRNREENPMEDPYGFDITEIDGFDDLHEPEGILKEGMDLAADLYGAARSWYLINGSTAGILAAISACTVPGDRVLMARNCHKSVYHGLILNQLEPVYLHPAVDPVSGILAGIDPGEVEMSLREAEDRKEKISLVILTSPTYEGILSDIQMIAAVCHSHGVPLLVDEAHGAHLSSGKLYGSCFPEGAVAGGADLVVQSLHKTLPSLTQTGLIHQQGNLCDPGRVKHFLDIYQTSSPSYVLMASIDRCVRRMASDSRRILGDWGDRLRDFYTEAAKCRVLQVLTLDSCELFFDWDPSKLVVSTRGAGHTGRELMELLRRDHHIEVEMASADYIIAMTGAGDTAEGIRRFTDAILTIDEAWAAEAGEKRVNCPAPDWRSFREERMLLPHEADRMQGESVDLIDETEGRTSLEFVYAYPPGIPVLVPGEKIGPEALQIIRAYEAAGIPMKGYGDTEHHKIRVSG